MPATDCALLIAIPATEVEFRADAAAHTDFVAHQLGAVDGDVERAWSRYAPYARFCEEVAAHAARRGATVAMRATLPQVADAMSTRAVVTLVAHSRGPAVVPEDVLDPDALRAASPSIIGAAAHWTPDVGNPPAGDVAGHIAWLNRMLDADLGDASRAEDVLEIRVAAHRAHLYTQRWMRRRAIEAAAGSALVRSVGFEFADGFQPLESIDAMLPDRLTGTLDLTVCDSTQLAELLRAKRTGGIILANADATSLDFRLALYRQTIALMDRRKVSYADAAFMLRRHLKRTLCRV